VSLSWMAASQQNRSGRTRGVMVALDLCDGSTKSTELPLLAPSGRASVAQGLPVFEAKRPVTRGTGSSARDPSGCSTCKSKATQGDVGSVSTCASWRIPVVVGYAAARLRGMKRDAVPGMSINGRQASV